MAKSVKTKRRVSTAQTAVATAAGVHPSDVQSLTVDSGEYIRMYPIPKSKGDGVAGYQVQLEDADGRILDLDRTAWPKAHTAIVKGQEKWGHAELDTGKALTAFFDGFVERYNRLMSTEKSSSEVFELLREAVEAAAE